MTVGEALFSFRGRMSRSDYWLKGVLPILPVGLINGLVFWSNPREPDPISIAISLVMIWPGMALYTKRLHDRGRSAWLLATFLIPIAGALFAIWIAVECWFLRGTVGPNRFGEDPLRPAAGPGGLAGEAAQARAIIPEAAPGRPGAPAAVPSWTWADMLSSHQYWALVTLTVLSQLSLTAFRAVGPVAFRQLLGLPPDRVQLLFIFGLATGGIAFLLGWAASGARPIGGLLASAAVQCTGGLLLWLGRALPPLLVGSVLFHAGAQGILLGVAVAIAGGRGSKRDFLVSYGTSWLFVLLAGSAGAGVSALASAQGIGRTLYLLPALVLTGMIFVLGATGPLFSEAPPPRGTSLDPVDRSPAAVVALTWLVPFYALYWLYRAHGEAARLAPSRRLLGPGAVLALVAGTNLVGMVPLLVLLVSGSAGAVGPSGAVAVAAFAVTFLPLLAVILATLGDVLDEAARALGGERRGSTTRVLILGVLVPPLAFGLVQASLGRLARLTKAAGERPVATAGGAAG